MLAKKSSCLSRTNAPAVWMPSKFAIAEAKRDQKVAAKVLVFAAEANFGIDLACPQIGCQFGNRGL